MNLAARRGRRLRRDQPPVAFFPDENQVEVVEGAAMQLAGAEIADVDAAPRRRLDGPRVRRLADMVVVGADRVGRDSVGEPGFGDEMPEHALGGRRTADVSGADEEDSDHWRLFPGAHFYSRNAGVFHSAADERTSRQLSDRRPDRRRLFPRVTPTGRASWREKGW